MASNNNNYHKGSVVGGVVLVFLGLLFLVQGYLHIDLIDKLWPLILIIGGLSVIFSAKSK